MKKILIIGAGIAGISSAIQLRAQGYDVEIYEKESTIGGKMSQIQSKGYTFDVGPTILMMPDVYKEVFKLAGKNPDDYITLSQINPIYSVFYSNHDRLDVSTDLVDLIKFLEGISEKDALGYMQYLSEIYKRYLVAKDHFIEKSFRKPTDFYNPKTLLKALELKTFDSAYHAISQFVKDDRLRKLLSFQTLYIGISPYNGPSIYSIIPMIEMIYGIWFIKGGMYGYVQGLSKLMNELGVKVHTETTVEEIVIENKQVKGIRVDGKLIEADIVLTNADFPYAMKNLIKDEKLRKPYTDAKIEKMDYSCSTFMMYLGVNHKLDNLNVHNILFSPDFDGNISEIFDGTLPKDPSMYFYCPAKLDPSLAPKGKEALYVLVPIPNQKTFEGPWDEAQIQSYRRLILDKIKESGMIPDLEAHIETEVILTPKDWNLRYNAHYGATFGLAPTLMQSNYYRPHNTFSKIKNLYFTGSSVHPGAGVPIVLTSAKLAVGDILTDHGKQK